MLLCDFCAIISMEQVPEVQLCCLQGKIKQNRVTLKLQTLFRRQFWVLNDISKSSMSLMSHVEGKTPISDHRETHSSFYLHRFSSSPDEYTLCEVVSMTSQYPLVYQEPITNGHKNKEQKGTRTILRGFFQDQVLEKRRFLIYAYNFFDVESRQLLTQTNSILCLICAEFLETSDTIAVFKRSQQDLRGTLCKILASEFQ